VSRRHLALKVVAQGLRVTDLDSTGGTFVNGVRTREALLAGEEILRIGETVLSVERLADAPALPLPSAKGFGRVLGASAAMRRLYRSCEQLAASDVPLLIEGEVGTGKEILAESIHERGPRAKAPFVVFDCTSLPPDRVEGALFGDRRAGAFEAADRGTLFLDDITALDLRLQAELDRTIHRSAVRRRSGDDLVHVDVRVIAASRRDIDRRIERGLFRSDLFQRLASARIELPPLRERDGDVELLAEAFWFELTREEQLPNDLVDGLLAYSWPGNVAELHDFVAARAAVEASGEAQRLAPSPELERVLALDLPLPHARRVVLEGLDHWYAIYVLARCGGDVARAARASGLARRAFQRLVE
jgi:DNA-binding NtrC family response regulator